MSWKMFFNVATPPRWNLIFGASFHFSGPSGVAAPPPCSDTSASYLPSHVLAALMSSPPGSAAGARPLPLPPLTSSTLTAAGLTCPSRRRHRPVVGHLVAIELKLGWRARTLPVGVTAGAPPTSGPVRVTRVNDAHRPPQGPTDLHHVGVPRRSPKAGGPVFLRAS